MNKLFKTLILISAICFAPDYCNAQNRSCINYDESSVTIFSPSVRDTVRLFIISDTHLFHSDAREEPYRQYSARMARAYNKTRHFQTGAETNPEECLRASMKLAQEFRADAILNLGDLINFPSEYGAELSIEIMNSSGIPWYFIEGNHDWHYEGLPGTEAALREEWSAKRLSKLYKGQDHLNYAVNIKGLKILMVSDGTHEILPSQVNFLKKQLKSNEPTILCMHVPLYAPGRSDRSFTIGNPNWGAAVDKGFKAERRPRWPEHHAQADYDFYDTAIEGHSKHNLLAAFCGHVHVQTSSILKGLPMYTLKDNASGGYLKVTVIPIEK